MNPSKSVTAIIGLSDWPQMARIRGCAYCSMLRPANCAWEENTVGIEIPQNKFLILDGAMGTVLQQRDCLPKAGRSC